MNNNILFDKYKNFSIYTSSKLNNYTYSHDEILEFSKRIIDNNFETIFKFKDTERNFVAKIKIDDKFFILKSPKAETIIPLRRLQTALKNGEGLQTLINLSKYKSIGFNFFVPPISIIVKKEFFIKESFILMEFIEGNSPKTSEFIDKIIDVINIMHKNKIYHGDLNASNFIETYSGIKVIDTQGKLDFFSNFNRAYDYLTLKKDLLVLELKYDINKKFQIDKFTLGYLFAFLIKEFKYIPIIVKIRSFKKYLREKGWKI